MHRLELTRLAEADLAQILERSSETFGPQARHRYETLLALGFGDLQADPLCAGSQDRTELGLGVRTYHLRHCRTRAKSRGAAVGDPRHLFAYEFDTARVLVLRVLHDAMDLGRHVPPATLEDGV